jgi:hypothetical protein
VTFFLFVFLKGNNKLLTVAATVEVAPGDARRQADVGTAVAAQLCERHRAWRRASRADEQGSGHGGDGGALVTMTVALRCDGDRGVAVDFGSLTMLLVKSQLSRVTVGGAALYIRGAFLMSVVLMRLRPKIIIYDVGCLYTTDTTYY